MENESQNKEIEVTEKEKEFVDLLEIREQVHANIWYTSQSKNFFIIISLTPI